MNTRIGSSPGTSSSQSSISASSQCGSTSWAKTRPPYRNLCGALTGFGVGVVASSAYLILDGEYFWNIPLLAHIVFYPGFVAGYQVYESGFSQEASKIVGVLAVGCAYAVLAWLLLIGWRVLKHTRHSVSEGNSPTERCS